jgi:hypothetical protein
MVAWEGFEENMGEALAFRQDPRFVEYRERFAAWLDELGIDLDPDTFSGRPPRCLVLIPRALQPHADAVDAEVDTFVGPSLDRRPHQATDRSPRSRSSSSRSVPLTTTARSSSARASRRSGRCRGGS